MKVTESLIALIESYDRKDANYYNLEDAYQRIHSDL